MTRVAGGFAVLVVIVGLGACGGGSRSRPGGATSTASGLPRTDLAVRADAICAAAAAKILAVHVPPNLASDATATVAYLDAVFAINDQAIKAIQALTPAADVAGDWRAFVGALVTVNQLVQTATRTARTKGQGALTDVIKSLPTGRRPQLAAATEKFDAPRCRI